MTAPTWDAILRKHGIGIHPAATLFPLIAADELEELARDIDTNNMTSPLCLWRADEKSDRAVARDVGVSHHTVASVREDVEARGQIAHVDKRVDSQGRQQPATKPARPAAAPAPAAPVDGAKPEWDAAASEMVDPQATTARDPDEWYTPSTILDPARKVTGHFHLDPASCELAQKTVGARRYYGKAEDGLAQDWTAASVWLNPPYSAIGAWVSKLLAEYQSGRVKSAILLVNNATCTAWFHDAARAASAFCFLRGRVQSYGPDGETGRCRAQARPGAVVLRGGSRAAFAREFSGLGVVLTPLAAETPAADTAEAADIVCERPKGCGYGTCKAEGRCLYAKPEPKVFRPAFQTRIGPRKNVDGIQRPLSASGRAAAAGVVSADALTRVAVVSRNGSARAKPHRRAHWCTDARGSDQR
jgi:phage N-6-adenine-methyltransferase